MAVLIPRLLLVIACATLAACARPQPVREASPAPGPARRSIATARPASGPTRPVAPVPSARPSGSLAPTATPVRPVILAPSAPPRIIAISMEPSSVRAGETLRGTVTASSNVASVEVRIGGYGVGMQKVGVGRFALSYVVPNVPFLHGTFVAQVIARNTAGASVQRSVPIQII